MSSQVRVATLPAQAFIELNDQSIAVRMRRSREEATDSQLHREASQLIGEADRVSDFRRFRPRLSTDEQYWGVYLEFQGIQGDVEQVKGVLIECLTDLGYTMSQTRFPI